MQFNTDLYYVPLKPFTKVNPCGWSLWFTEAEYVEDRQQVLEHHKLPVKPTKRQIRKLRRAFRKSI